MQLSKLVKGIAIALPIMALAACSSTDESGTSSQTNAESATTGVGGTAGNADSGADVKVSQLERDKEFQRQEKLKQQQMLRQNMLISFDFDQSRIGGEFFEMLEAHANYLKENANVNVVVEGHADERGTPEYNIALGERRAKAVARYLQNMGVLSSQISVVSYGEEKPVNTSRTEAAFAENRRAVLVY